MNCKQGDVARVLYLPNLPDGCYGHICTCVAPTRHPDLGWPAWVIDPPLANGHNCIVDAYLRPIRDSDCTDETLTWAPKPETVVG